MILARLGEKGLINIFIPKPKVILAMLYSVKNGVKLTTITLCYNIKIYISDGNWL